MKQSMFLCSCVLVCSVSPALASENQRIEISIDASGEVRVHGRKIDDKALDAALQQLAAKDAHAQVLIVAAEKAPLAEVSRVMDLCRKSGLNKISLQSK